MTASGRRRARQAGRLGCRSLIISQNGLAALPPGLGALIAITSLSCAENRLVELPDELSILAGTLTHLDARFNQRRGAVIAARA